MLSGQGTKDAKRLHVEVGRVRVDFFLLLITTADEASAIEERTVAILESIDPLGGDDLLPLLRREVLHENARAEDTAI